MILLLVVNSSSQNFIFFFQDIYLNNIKQVEKLWGILEGYNCVSDLCGSMTLERKTFSSFFEVGRLCGFRTVCTSETSFFLSHTEVNQCT